ncbi:hypothetical protein JW933_05070 [candidate division FCPU426 bacterium]|nr:hypothetical protein [candidate division FCPU426 bacterium]
MKGQKKQVVVMLVALLGWGSAPVLAKTGGTILQDERMNLGVWLGYTSVFMDGLNEELNDFQEDYLRPLGYIDSRRLQQAGGALKADITFDFAVSKDITVGPRFGVLSMFPAEVYGRRVGANYIYEWTSTVGATLLTLAGGLAYTPWRAETEFSISLGADMGLALGYGNWKSEYETDNPGWPMNLYNYDIPFAGNCLYLNMYATANYDLDADKTIYVLLGYRIADMDSVIMTKSIADTEPFGPIINGDPFEGIDQDPLAFDFSGFEIGAGIRMYF